MNMKVTLNLKWEDLEEHYHLHYVLTLFAAPIFLSLNLNFDNIQHYTQVKSKFNIKKNKMKI